MRSAHEEHTYSNRVRMTETLPHECYNVIRAYFCLDFGPAHLVRRLAQDGDKDRVIICPYYRNALHQRRFGSVAETGKGTPEEIIHETFAKAAMMRISLSEFNADQIRAFMIREGIGIDCSGFVVRVLDPWITHRSGRSISSVLSAVSAKLWKRILYRFRPFHNIDVRMLTDLRNCRTVAWQDMKPGDLIRTRGGKHVLLVSAIERNSNHELTSFIYVHSSQAFGSESGVREGTVVITHPHALLEQQEWQEVWDGSRPTQEGWNEERERNGIFRLKVFA